MAKLPAEYEYDNGICLWLCFRSVKLENSKWRSKTEFFIHVGIFASYSIIQICQIIGFQHIDNDSESQIVAKCTMNELTLFLGLFYEIFGSTTIR